jgi:gluconate 2-dehydrogenase alpha chain
LKTGRYTVRTNAKVVRINVGANGLATGVTYIDENGQEQEQPADLVLLTAYTLSNVRLLLLSTNDRHPQGVGNDRGMVGKNYTYQHWHTIVNGVFPGRRFNLFMGNTSTVNVIYDVNADNFDHSELDFIGGASLFASEGERDPLTSVDTYPIKDTRNQPSSGPPSAAQESQKAKEQVAKSWGKAWKEALRTQWNSTAYITMQGESLPYEDQFLDLDPVYKDNHGLPLLRLTFDWHDNDYNMYRFVTKTAQKIMERMGAQIVDVKSELEPYNIHEYQSTHCTGGAIMGTDPSNSVCNKYGQVWDTPNVFVAGAALYPQNPGANPTGTLLALTYMAGDAIRDNYFKAPDQLLG